MERSPAKDRSGARLFESYPNLFLAKFDEIYSIESPPPPSIFILTVPRRYFCCGSLLLLVLAVSVYTLVQLLC